MLIDRSGFKSGYSNFEITIEEWNEAKARATGQLDNAMAFFAPIFQPPIPRIYITTVTRFGSISRRWSSSGDSGPAQIIDRPRQMQV